MCKYNLNQELNGIELSFEAKPAAEVIASVKAHGFRWSPKNKIWYAKQSAERLEFAKSLGDLAAPAPLSAPSVINLENLGEMPENFSRYGAELAGFIREDLKKRGVKGCTVRARKITYDTGITVTVKATAEDFASLEECAERYTQCHFSADLQNRNGLYTSGHWMYIDEYEKLTEEEQTKAYYNYLTEQINGINSFSTYHQDRNRDYWMISTAFYNKCIAIFRISNQWNYDHSDSMTDYFDVGYYLDIDIKHEEVTPRATMTEEERKALEDERQKEREEFEQFQREQEEKRRQYEEESKIYDAWVEESTEIIYNDISIEDLEEPEQLFISGLVGGYGKESTLEELNETINNREETLTHDAVVSRIVRFKSEDAFNRFSNMFLHDFAFIEGKGGTATEDTRLPEHFDLFKLNESQRESIKFFSFNCIAIYLDNDLKYIIDPQGFSYSRYVYIADGCEILNAPAKLEELREESAALDPFYFPAPVEEQINNISVGDNIVVWQCDGWLLFKVLDGFGTVKAITPGTWAQYNGIFIDLQQGRKEKRVFIRNNHACLIYKGLDVLLPEEVTRRRISDTMSELYNYDVLLPNIYNYFKGLGKTPAVDTWQR